MDEATITPYPDGPLLVRGSFQLVSHGGEPIENHRKTVALCRCGRSSIRPFCDGTHRRIKFKAPGGDTRAWTTGDFGESSGESPNEQ